MGRPQRRKKIHKGDKPLKEKYRTRRKTKDLDEIHEDMKAPNTDRLLNQPVDLNRPGNAQHYCLHCAKYFVTLKAMKDHFRTKLHKKRIKKLSIEPYTTQEAERAAGMGNYVAPKKLTVKTQDIKEKMDETEDVAPITECTKD